MIGDRQNKNHNNENAVDASSHKLFLNLEWFLRPSKRRTKKTRMVPHQKIPTKFPKDRQTLELTNGWGSGSADVPRFSVNSRPTANQNEGACRIVSSTGNSSGSYARMLFDK